MKVNRNGQAEILADEQLDELFATLPQPHRLIAALCYYTSCRVSEAISLKTEDINNGRIIFRRVNTKQKRTKEVSIPTKLQAELDWVELPKTGYLFPGKYGGHITRQTVDHAIRKATDYIGLPGVSSHSFRRTAITKMYRAGVDLKTIQQRSGHASIANVGIYIQGLDGAADTAGELL